MSASKARRSASHAEEKEQDFDYEQNILTQNFAFNKAHKVKKQPGPATFKNDRRYTEVAAPRATIGKEERFSNNFAGMFVRAEAASELQCRMSPGPVYSPTFANLPRAPTVSWGEKPAPEDQVSKFRDPHLFGLTAGPAAYTPKIEHIKSTAGRCKFGKSDRFQSFGGNYSLNNSPYTSDGVGPPVNYNPVRPRSAAFSFGGGKVRPPGGGDTSDIRSRPRTAFLTHSIRGGLARPATLECGIGPADYNTDQTAINRNLKKQRDYSGFGSAPRFPRPGLVFLSAEHAKADGTVCSPGPKYASTVNSLTFKPRQALTSLHWCP